MIKSKCQLGQNQNAWDWVGNTSQLYKTKIKKIKRIINSGKILEKSRKITGKRKAHKVLNTPTFKMWLNWRCLIPAKNR